MLVRTGQGKYYITLDTGSVFSACLYNFDIDGAEVKPSHRDVLREKVVKPFLQTGGSVAVMGLASTSAGQTWDLDLSRHRAEGVAAYLWGALMVWGTDPFNPGPARRDQIRKVEWHGKEMALHFGPDNTENEFWRAVWVRAWDKTLPSTARDLAFDMTLPQLPGSLVLDLGQALDVTAWVVSLTLGELVPVLDMAVSIIDTLAALPLAWAAGDQAAYVNGFILGYNGAMQDMADAFRDSNLDSRPESTWPEIPRPQPHTAGWSAQPSVSQEKSHQGERDGCNAAYEAIKKLESSPKTVSITARGRERKVKLTGKLNLRLMAAKFRDQVATYFMVKWNHYLRDHGKKEFPTI